MVNLRTSPIIAALTLLSVASWSFAQDAPARWFRVNSDNAFVRCDASATVAYPVGRVPKGAVRGECSRQLADLVVPDRDYFACAETDIADTSSWLTVVGGRIAQG